MDDTADIVFHGKIRTGARKCYASFPGKYATGWDALIQQLGGDSVGCVFLCTPADGLGKHHPDPRAPKDSPVRCYCPRIYGKRCYRSFGYLNIVQSPCSDKKLNRELEKAEYTNAVVVKSDATEEEMREAEKKAQQAWTNSGGTASWGCYWYHVWLQQVEEAVAQGQKLQVVFFPNECGKGIESMENLSSPEVNLWDGIGCGGSQKCEVATLDEMRQKEGPQWKYDMVDVADFLNEQFQLGNLVDAWHNDTWHRGTLIEKPEAITKNPAKTWWKVKCTKSGEVFDSQHLRHVTDSIQTLLRSIGQCTSTLQVEQKSETSFIEDLTDSVKTREAKEKLFEALGHDAVKKILQDTVPEGVDVGVTSEQLRASNGLPSVSVTLQIHGIEHLQQLRDDVLTGDLDAKINKVLDENSCPAKIEIDKTRFCRLFERSLLSFRQLTQHQAETLQKFEEKTRCWHISAPAGSGKTFLAVQRALDILKKNEVGRMVFVAPQASLAMFFLRWLATRYAATETSDMKWRKVNELFSRLCVIISPYEELLTPTLTERSIRFDEKSKKSDERFLLAVCDEAHHIFRAGRGGAMLEDILRSKHILLLSDDSQSLLDHALPQVEMQHEALQQVVRCTKRIVGGAAAFHYSRTSRDIICAGTGGPPLLSFLFHADAPVLMQGYVDHTCRAILHIMQTYPGLLLHGRLALLVPDLDFLQKFKHLLLKNQFSTRPFVLKTCEESMQLLPQHLCPEAAVETDEEMIILDEIGNVVGLEHLFVICIGLDAKIRNTSEDAVTRARLYQAITRAQLVAIVVNEYLQGGWLQFISLLKFEEEVFQERKAIGETRGDAAAAVMEHVHQEVQVVESTIGTVEKSEDDPVRSEPAEIKREDAQPKPALRISCIWETKNNDIPADKMQAELRYNPLAKVESAEPQIEGVEGSSSEAEDAAAAAKYDDILGAARAGDLPAVRGFVRRDADSVKQKESWKGWTALHFAARYGDWPELVRFLLEQNAEVNAVNDYSQTALYLAAYIGHLDTVRVLLDFKADVNMKNIDGETPLDLARQGRKTEVVKLLEAAKKR